jgi:hypothetical protein
MMCIPVVYAPADIDNGRRLNVVMISNDRPFGM